MRPVVLSGTGCMGIQMARRRFHQASLGFHQPALANLGAAHWSSVLAAVIVFVGDCLTPADFVVGVFYLNAMLLAAQTRSRPWLAGIALASAVLTILAAMLGAPPLLGTAASTVAINRTLTVLALRGLLLVLDQMMRFQVREDLLRRGVDHRAEDILAAVNALLRLVPRDDPPEFAGLVEDRVHAMARVHSLLANARWEGADLRTLMQSELAPFAGLANRIHYQGPPVRLKTTVAQPLGMVLHELATNSAKHGAFCEPTGRLTLGWRIDVATAELVLEWTEMGGPAIPRPPERRGFGTRLMAGMVRQVGGTLEPAWPLTGLHCLIRLPGRSCA